MALVDMDGPDRRSAAPSALMDLAATYEPVRPEEEVLNMATEGEKIAVLETKIEALHQDLHMLSNQLDTCTRSIEALRQDLHGRPSWGVVFTLTFMSSLIVALTAALVATAT